MSSVSTPDTDPPPPTLPSPLPSQVAAVLARARIVPTPCGAGSLHWHIWGDLQGPGPVVLLHGGSGSWTHWLRNIEPLLERGRAVMAPDLPGFGDSALPPTGRDADALPAPLEQGLYRLLGQRACDLVGFSFGGMVAGLWARAVPERVRRLVLVAPPGLGLPALDRIKPKAWRHLSDPIQRQAAHQHNVRELMLHELMLHDESSLWPLACALQQINAERDRLTGRRLAQTDVLAQALRQVHAPTRLIYGEHDRYYLHRVDAIESVLRLCPGYAGSHCIAGAGHWVQFERPDAFQAALSDIGFDSP